MDNIEYRVRPVTRYIITRFESRNETGGKGSCGSSVLGEYNNEETAREVASALCKAEHDRPGWPPGDERIQYPRVLGAQIGGESADRFPLSGHPVRPSI